MHVITQDGAYALIKLEAHAPDSKKRKASVIHEGVEVNHIFIDVREVVNESFTSLALHPSDPLKGLSVLYNDGVLFCFRLSDLIQTRLDSNDPQKEKELQLGYFKISLSDIYRVIDCRKVFKSALARIQHVVVHSCDLIHVLSSQGRVYVFNHTLQNKMEGLIFELRDYDANGAPMLGIHVPNLESIGVVEKPAESMEPTSTTDKDKELSKEEKMKKVDQFLLGKNLRPRGLFLTVQSQAVRLWDFDEQLNKKAQSCKLMCQLIFSNQSKILDCAFSQNLVLLQHQVAGDLSAPQVTSKLHSNVFSVITINKSEQSQDVVFTQLNLFKIEEAQFVPAHRHSSLHFLAKKQGKTTKK